MTNQIGLFEHFRLLLRFGGREDRGSFWPYAALAFGILTTCNILIMLPMMLSIGHAFDDGALLQLPNFGVFFAAMGALGILLYAAAVARRLRDCGRSPLWGLMPLPFGACSILGMVQIFRSPFDGIPPDMTMMQLMMAANALYSLSLIAVFGMLTMRSVSPRGGDKAKRPAPHYHEQ